MSTHLKIHCNSFNLSEFVARYHVEDGRDVGTRTQAWHNEKKAELQRKERELKRTQRQQVGLSLLYILIQALCSSFFTKRNCLCCVCRNVEVSVRLDDTRRKHTTQNLLHKLCRNAGVPEMAKKSKAYTKDLNSDVIMRNEQFAEQRSAKLAEAKTTREEEQSKKQKEALALSKTSANLVSQGRYASTLSRACFTLHSFEIVLADTKAQM